MREPIVLFDVPMHPWTMVETLEEIERRMDAGLFTQHVVVNVAKLVNIQSDLHLHQSVTNCDIINIDGAGVVLGGRWVGHDIPERVAGIDLFSKLLAMAVRRNEPVFFLGATQDVVNEAVNNLRAMFPSLIICGWHHGYFWENEEEVVDTIRGSGATMLFVAITSPKKEQFINKWRDRLGVKFAMGVGGTFDIFARKSSRAPLWMQRASMEWIYRIYQEPRRMWKRYLRTNSIFLFLILKQKLMGSK